MTRTKTIQISAIQKKIFFVLVAVVAMLLIVLFYLNFTLFSNTIAIKDVEAKISLLRGELMPLEAEVLKLDNLVTEELAREKGFVVGISNQYFSLAQ